MDTNTTFSYDCRQTLFDEARESELRILGAILCEPEKLSYLKSRLKPESFLHKANRLIYTAMLESHDAGIPVDELTLYNLLSEREELEEVGGSMYLTYLTAMLRSEQVARDSEETDRILAWLRNGGTITIENR